MLTCWTTAGSCINFCDVFMTGGTSRYDHSEIGSGAMHFNFSPRRDKFASAFGDVRGLLLRSKPVFVGGNTGIVAPCEVAFGKVVPAGTTLRQDSGTAKIENKLRAGLNFIRTLDVVRCWYEHVRLPSCNVREAALVGAGVRAAPDAHPLAGHGTPKVSRADRIIRADLLRAGARQVHICKSFGAGISFPVRSRPDHGFAYCCSPNADG